MIDVLNKKYAVLAEPIIDTENGDTRITYPFQPSFEIGHIQIIVKGYEKYDWHIVRTKRRTFVTGAVLKDLESYLTAYLKEQNKSLIPIK